MAGAFLSPGLTAAAADLGTGQSGLGALTLVGQVGDNRQVHGSLVGLNAEHGLGKLDLGNGFASHIKYRNLRHWYSSFPYAFLLSVRTTRPPLGPGIAPLTAIRLFSTSTLTTSRFWTVTCSEPM